MVFWHPFDNGHVMDMGTPEEFFVVHRGEKTDLSESLTPITFTGADSAGKGWEGVLPIRRNGDYIVGLVPAPYYEESEDVYIQQLTKVFFNKAGIPTDWMEPVGMETEFVPLNKPYNVLTGSSFSAQLLSNGAPVPGAEIEIEYMAAEPDMDANAPGPVTAAPPPGGAIVAVTDPNGVFTFALPKAGFWGFAALGSGPDTEHEGKALSQDAVIWVRAYDLE
jgi:cobalt/nickel transport protein